jgi:hypothetical protein
MERTKHLSAALISVIAFKRLVGARRELKTLPSATSAGRRGTILGCREMMHETHCSAVLNAVKIDKRNISLTLMSKHFSAQHARRERLILECSPHQPQSLSLQHPYPHQNLSPRALRRPSKSNRKSSLKTPKLKKKSSVKAATKSKKDLRLLSLRSKKMKGINSLLLLNFHIRLDLHNGLLIPSTNYGMRRLELHLANGAIPTEEQKQNR